MLNSTAITFLFQPLVYVFVSEHLFTCIIQKQKKFSTEKIPDGNVQYFKSLFIKDVKFDVMIWH